MTNSFLSRGRTSCGTFVCLGWLLPCLMLCLSCSDTSDRDQVSVEDEFVEGDNALVESPNVPSGTQVEPQSEVESEAVAETESASLDPRTRRRVALEDELQRTAPTGWSEVLEKVLGPLDDPQRREILGDLATSLAAQSPDSARSVVAALASPLEKQSFASAVVLSLLEKDTVAAREWVNELEDRSLQRGTASALARAWSRRDPQGVVDWLAAMDRAALRESVLEGLVWGWAQRDREAAYEWVQGLEDEGLQGLALLKLTKVVALRDPKAAADWVVGFPESRARIDGLKFALHRWGRGDLTDVMAWVSELEDVALFREGTLMVASIWAQESPRSVVQWAEDLPGELRGDALGVVVDEWGRQEPVEAMMWAFGLGDEEFSARLLHRIAAAWALRDSDAYSKWVTEIEDPALKAAIGGDAIEVAR